jgi:sterol desaturase/sphingolipid hydroxylase (fatty acid hydroxylase superfamily)
MKILIFLSVAIVTYYLMSILQAVLHRSHGHKNRIRAVFRAHAIGHHGRYPPKRLQSTTFEALESHALYYYGIPVVVIAAIASVVLDPLLTIAYLVGVFVTFSWNIYLHRQYHLRDSPLDGFAWFRKKRALHFVHHRNARVNFAVVEFWIDALMGTLRKH